jgi:uncharacterized membrane protein YeaQ/YmgE (transglycosylase-associated protein family)
MNIIIEGLKAIPKNVGDTIVVGTTGATVYSNTPPVLPDPYVSEIVKIIVGIVSAIISHFLINLFNRKSEGKI